MFARSKNQFLNEKTGSTAEINLFLADLFNRAGIEAYPVILSTRKNGKVFEGYPFLNQFNSVIVMLIHEKDTLLADATEPLLSYNMIPSSCLNGKGLIIHKSNHAAWCPLKENKTSELTTLLNLKYTENTSQFQGDYVLKYTGYLAYNLRSSLINDKEKTINSLVKNGIATIDSIKILNEDSVNLPLIIKSQVRVNTMQNLGQIILSPFALSLKKDNPFKEKKRDYPLDMDYTEKVSYLINIALPPSYQLKQTPSSVRTSIAGGGIDFFYQTQALNKTDFQISAVFQTSKTIFRAKDYMNLKEFYQQMLDKLEEPLILAKSE